MDLGWTRKANNKALQNFLGPGEQLEADMGYARQIPRQIKYPANLANPPKHVPTAFGKCNHCLIRDHCCKVDWCNLISLDGTSRIRTLGLTCWAELNMTEDWQNRSNNLIVWRGGDRVGIRRNNLLGDNRPAQLSGVEYGGSLETLNQLVADYSNDCPNPPYALQANQAGTLFLDARTSRRPLAMANTARVGAGAGEQANCRFSFPTPVGHHVWATVWDRITVRHGDLVFAHYGNNTSLTLRGAFREFKHETS